MSLFHWSISLLNKYFCCIRRWRCLASFIRWTGCEALTSAEDTHSTMFFICRRVCLHPYIILFVVFAEDIPHCGFYSRCIKKVFFPCCAPPLRLPLLLVFWCKCPLILRMIHLIWCDDGEQWSPVPLCYSLINSQQTGTRVWPVISHFHMWLNRWNWISSIWAAENMTWFLLHVWTQAILIYI